MLKPVCRMPVLSNAPAFRKALREWFSRHGKDYPWRRTHDPYAVLVSEVMLQQTRIATVLDRGFFSRFLERFPTVEALAGAEDADLLKAWEGLGYYRRARMLRATAQAVLEEHGGKFPESVEGLVALPGVGRYTAGALRAFAFGLPAVLVDGNVVRVLARLLDEEGDVHGTAGMRQMWKWAAALADDRYPQEYHSALMELGQTHCKPGQPRCVECPVAGFCKTRNPDMVPARKPRTKPEEMGEIGVWWRDDQRRVLLHCEAGSRRTGLWKLPLRRADQVKGMPGILSMQYTITRYRVSLQVMDGGRVMEGSVEESGDVWVPMDDIPKLAMGAPFRRAIGRLLQDF